MFLYVRIFYLDRRPISSFRVAKQCVSNRHHCQVRFTERLEKSTLRRVVRKSIRRRSTSNSDSSQIPPALRPARVEGRGEVRRSHSTSIANNTIVTSMPYANCIIINVNAPAAACVPIEREKRDGPRDRRDSASRDFEGQNGKNAE